MSKRTAIITGVAGFIGSHLALSLLESGAKVIGVDNFITGQKKNIERLQSSENAENFYFVEADAIKRPETYLPAHLVARRQVDYIFHLASPASPPRYQAHPIETYQVNTLGTHNLLQFIREQQPQARFLFASTSEVYGDPKEHPQSESYWGNVNPNGRRSCYDESKRFGETICGVHQRDFGLDVRIIRVFDTYGPHMDADDGRVIPNFIKQALAGEPYTIYGDGSQTRSYCFVADTVKGILKMMEVDNLSGETINIGDTDEYSILATARAIHALVTNDGSEPKFEFHDLPEDDPARRRPDISKAFELLAWQPEVSFQEGLTATIEYFQGSKDE